MNATTTTESTLLEQLKVLNHEQLQAIYAHYGKKGLDLWEVVIDTPGDRIFEEAKNMIEADTNKEQKDMLLLMLEEYYKNFVPEKAKLVKLEEAAKAATQARTDLKRAVATRIATFTNDLRDNVTGDNKDGLDKKLVHQELAKERLKRDEIRRKGKRAYLRGVVAAAIDGMEYAYMKECNKGAKLVSQAARAAADAISDPHFERGTKEVYQACKDVIKDAMEYEHKTNSMDAAIAAQPTLPSNNGSHPTKPKR